MVFSGMKKPEVGQTAELLVKLRYLAPQVRAFVKFTEDGAEVELEQPARAVTPGQSAVFYADGAVMAGGFISFAE